MYDFISYRTMEIMKVVAVVVTYNRKKLLIECLSSIINQSYPIDKIVLIDNASTDGTYEALKKSGLLFDFRMDYNLMTSNLGGAGGFSKGIEIAKKCTADWIWVMDDDSIPDIDCLYELVNCVGDKISFLASNVYGLNGEPMNVPQIDLTPMDNGYPYWYKKLDEGLIKIKAATFVSILINRKAINQCGLPCKDYFIWGDDSEYTQRLVTYYGEAYFVWKSKVCHKRVNAGMLGVDKETDTRRIKNFYYYYRNNLINIMLYDSNRKVIITCISNIIKSFILLFRTKNGLLKFFIIWKGLLSAIIERNKFNNYVSNQLKI